MIKITLAALILTTPAFARPHQTIHPTHVAQATQRHVCLKYLTVYAPDCPYLRGFCHGDFQMCDNQGGI